uniref:ATP synthase F0 subunit 8 n=1 Tax=Elateroidea sp. 2 KM-2017 TaxID=2219425 RepID=A0A346RG83_9COLE|nr:ATP synthase F0 subunit 8 [Elateroidea sp. 2 KM-2017]
MPQASPLWWLNILIFMNIILLNLNMLIYTFFNLKLIKEEKKKKKTTLNW